MSRLKVKVDVDNVLNNLVQGMFTLYELRTGTKLNYEDCINYDFEGIGAPYVISDLYDMFLDVEMWDNLIPPPNATLYLKKLNDQFDLVIATATDYRNFSFKVEWLLKYFPFLKTEQIICIHNKTLLSTDFAIDDYQENLKGDFAYRILVDAPWNRSVRDEAYGFYRVKDMKEAYEAIMEICKKEEWVVD